MKNIISIMTVVVIASVSLHAQRGGRDGAPVAATPRASAPIDITGQWVSLITEDWRYRQFTAPKGDYGGLPLLPAARTIADKWDPSSDEAAGEQCKAYGAAGLLRLPTRVRLSWRDDATLKLETEAGTQTRLFRFTPTPAAGGDWQGTSTASWESPQAALAGRGPARAPGSGALKVVTGKMRPGYLRRNGVPYSANAVLTEYFDRLDVPGGDSLLLVIAEVVDPQYLATPYWTSQQFKRETDTSRWQPTPCATR